MQLRKKMTVGDEKAQKIFDRIMDKANDRKIPVTAHLDLSFRCNLNCIHCYCQGLSDDFSQRQPEMSSDEIKRALDELADAGSLHLTLSGGEILIHPHFFEIARYARKKNFCLTLLTNGTLIDNAMARRIKELSPVSVDMSIYGVTAEIHDSITGKAGSFAKLLEAVKALKKNNLRVVLKATIMEPNFHQAGELADFALKAGADKYNFAAEISPKNDGSKSPQRFNISDDKIYRLFFDESWQPGKDPEYHDDPLQKPVCGTGAIGCYISPYGDVYPCIQLLTPMGNLKEKSFKEIWYSPSPIRLELEGLNTYRDMPECRSCKYVIGCKKCIGLAHLETNDIKKCYNTLRLLSKIEYESLTKRR